MAKNNRALVPQNAPPRVNPLMRILGELDNAVCAEFGEGEWTAKQKNGCLTLTGKTPNGAVQVKHYNKNGLKQRTLSACEPLSIENRRFEAKRLHRENHTQHEIAEILGVSQKTISNDLNHR
ncbi:MAG: helix-turn-helix domain-containing protein [Rhodanobacter sp.]|nr:MAG: helix-turn-helix domain-containing protein [Rhodanobacter sp.]